MKTGNTSGINFTASISAQVMHELDRQLKVADSGKKTGVIVKKQLQEIQQWGNNNAELVISKNLQGKKCLGLRIPVAKDLNLSWAIENLSGRTILSNILNLHKSHIESTENTIHFLYKKYGMEIFKKAKWSEKLPFKTVS